MPKRKSSDVQEKPAARNASKPPEPQREWCFLTPHALVLLCLVQNNELKLSEIGHAIGFTSRSVQRIVTELEEAGYITRDKDGRRNVYTVNLDNALRHPLETLEGATAKDLLAGLGLLPATRK